jgi:hypothetical protein
VREFYFCLGLAMVALLAWAIISLASVAATGIETGGAIITAWTSEHQTTERTDIEWEARTEIARIEADADKKTSPAFSLFWLTRFLLWLAAGFIGLSFLLKLKGGNHEQRNSALLGTDCREPSSIVVCRLGKRHPHWR